VGRIRYIGVLLYDADRIQAAAAAPDAASVYPEHLDILLDPHDPKITAEAERQGIAANFLAAARRSPVYRLIKEWRLALPLHPEFRTLPMVWYVPPLSPANGVIEAAGPLDGIDALRIPVRYLSNLLTAGDEEPVRLALKRLSALRAYMRSVRVGSAADRSVLEAVGLGTQTAEDMYRLLAIAHLSERFVLPTAGRKDETSPTIDQGSCGYPQ
jgi:nitrate reductase beta subunit